MAKAIEDRSSAFFGDDLDLRQEADLAKERLAELDDERSPNARLEDLRRAALRHVRGATATLAHYQEVDAKRPGGGVVAWDIAKTLLDTDATKNADTGKVERTVKSKNVFDALEATAKELVAQGELSDLRQSYWQRSIADRTVVGQLLDFEATRTDITRRALNRVVHGIGSTVSKVKSGVLRVESVSPDSGAWTAGLRQGDLILSVGGRETSGISIEEAVDTMRGPRGSYAYLRVQRGDQVLELQPQRLSRFELDASGLLADVTDNFNGAYRGNLLAVRNQLDDAVVDAVVFFVVSYADRANPVTYMRTVDRWAPGTWATLETNPRDAGTPRGKIAAMRAWVFSDDLRGWSDTSYDRAARDADIERHLATLVFSGEVLKATDSFFEGKQPPGFSCSFSKGPARLIPSTVNITFVSDDQVVTVPFSVKEWRLDRSIPFRNSQFGFAPKQVKIELQFLDSDVKKSATWNFE